MPYGKYVFLSHKIDKKSEYVKNIELFISFSGQLYILKISVVREILKTPLLYQNASIVNFRCAIQILNELLYYHFMHDFLEGLGQGQRLFFHSISRR